MATVGRKIYYEKNTGNIIKITESRNGPVVNTTIEEDFKNYEELKERTIDSAGVIQLVYGSQEETNVSKYPIHIDITKSTIDTLAIVYDTANPIGATLADFQRTKIAQIEDFYNQTLETGFTSSASGVAYTFEYGQTDQMKFMQLILAMNNNLLTYPVDVPAKDNTLVSLTQTQLQQLFQDINNFAWTQQNKLHSKINDINSATTIDAVNAITW